MLAAVMEGSEIALVLVSATLLNALVPPIAPAVVIVPALTVKFDAVLEAVVRKLPLLVNVHTVSPPTAAEVPPKAIAAVAGPA
jgi:hypothetical protein